MQSRVLRGTLIASQSRRRRTGPHARRRLHAAALAALGMLVLAGCGRSTVQIEASFRLDGKPLDDAGVSFVRIDAGGRMAAGITDAQGKLVDLTTYRYRDGIVPGTYRVVVTKTITGSTAPAAEAPPPQLSPEALVASSSMRDQVLEARPQGAQRKPRRSSLPDVYGDPAHSPLECVVDGATRTFVFDLESGR
ncbi:MAG: hypothetical protein ACKOCX_00200 [Planctomycetota bacterium]